MDGHILKDYMTDRGSSPASTRLSVTMTSDTTSVSSRCRASDRGSRDETSKSTCDYLTLRFPVLSFVCRTIYAVLTPDYWTLDLTLSIPFTKLSEVGPRVHPSEKTFIVLKKREGVSSFSPDLVTQTYKKKKFVYFSQGCPY